MTELPLSASLHRPIVADGAMGTALFAAGMPAGEAPESWLLTEAGRAAAVAVHRGHIDAGARIILASSFGSYALRVAGSRLEGRGAVVCRAAVDAARASVADAARAAVAQTTTTSPVDYPVIIAGSMGPTGGLLAPYGPLDPGAVRAAYAAQAGALVEAGVDVLWVETMMDLREAVAAVDGARDAAPQVPLVATLVFTRGRTMFGDRPADAAATLAGHGVAGVGANCGDGFGSVEEVIAALAAAAPGLHVIAKANAGAPLLQPDGTTVYPGTADEAAAYARRVADAGATIIGGCCGTAAAHIAAIAAALG
jgi:5-methyltetrahydrofolate--homocysteine methyltransferase